MCTATMTAAAAELNNVYGGTYASEFESLLSRPARAIDRTDRTAEREAAKVLARVLAAEPTPAAVEVAEAAAPVVEVAPARKSTRRKPAAVKSIPVAEAAPADDAWGAFKKQVVAEVTRINSAPAAAAPARKARPARPVAVAAPVVAAPAAEAVAVAAPAPVAAAPVATNGRQLYNPNAPWRKEAATAKQYKLLLHLCGKMKKAGISTAAADKKVGTKGEASDLIDLLKAQLAAGVAAKPGMAIDLQTCSIGPFARGTCVCCGLKQR